MYGSTQTSSYLDLVCLPCPLQQTFGHVFLKVTLTLIISFKILKNHIHHKKYLLQQELAPESFFHLPSPGWRKIWKIIFKKEICPPKSHVYFVEVFCSNKCNCLSTFDLTILYPKEVLRLRNEIILSRGRQTIELAVKRDYGGVMAGIVTGEIGMKWVVCFCPRAW